MKREDAVRRVARQLPTPFLRSYARAKLRTDPVYDAVVERLADYPQPLFDLGCGVGLLELYLRERGLAMPVLGIDHDAAKVRVALQAGAHYGGLEFKTGDARDALPPARNVVALDILHYFTDGEQTAIVDAIASAIPAGGIALIRDAVRDRSVRYRLTALQEAFARAIRWLKAERLHFPTRETIVAPFRKRGFEEEVVPLWGRTPFNNYLFVFRRSGSGTTQA